MVFLRKSLSDTLMQIFIMLWHLVAEISRFKFEDYRVSRTGASDIKLFWAVYNSNLNVIVTSKLWSMQKLSFSFLQFLTKLWYFCPWAFFQGNGLNLLPWNYWYKISILNYKILQECSRFCNWMSPWCWCRGLITCLLYVTTQFGNPVLNSYMKVWHNGDCVWYVLVCLHK